MQGLEFFQPIRCGGCLHPLVDEEPGQSAQVAFLLDHVERERDDEEHGSGPERNRVHDAEVVALACRQDRDADGEAHQAAEDHCPEL